MYVCKRVLCELAMRMYVFLYTCTYDGMRVP